MILGTIGIFFPVLPTTPFMLLAAFCFARSSKKAHDMLLSNKYLGPYIENYNNKLGVPKEVKVKSITLLWVALVLSAVIVQKIYVTIILLIVGIGVTTHLLRLKTREDD